MNAEGFSKVVSIGVDEEGEEEEEDALVTDRRSTYSRSCCNDRCASASDGVSVDAGAVDAVDMVGVRELFGAGCCVLAVVDGEEEEGEEDEEEEEVLLPDAAAAHTGLWAAHTFR